MAVSVFPDEVFQAPRSWTEQAYPNLIHYNEVDQGRALRRLGAAGAVRLRAARRGSGRCASHDPVRTCAYALVRRRDRVAQLRATRPRRAGRPRRTTVKALQAGGTDSDPRSACASSRREWMPSLVNTLRRCHSAVRGLRKSCAPISGFDSPSAASSAICRSCGVRSSRVSRVRRRCQRRRSASRPSRGPIRARPCNEHRGVCRVLRTCVDCALAAHDIAPVSDPGVAHGIDRSCTPGGEFGTGGADPRMRLAAIGTLGATRGPPPGAAPGSRQAR